MKTAITGQAGILSFLSLFLILGTCTQQPSVPGVLPAVPDGNHIFWQDDFEDGDLRGWEINDETDKEISNWYVEQGYLIQDTNVGQGKRGTTATAGDDHWTDYTLSANVVSTDDDYIGVVFRYQNPDNYYRFSLSSQIAKIRLEKRIDGKYISIGYLEKMWPKCRFNISIDMHGDSIKVYLDQEQVFAIADSSLHRGKVGFASYHNTASFFDDITVYDTLEIVRDSSLQFDRLPYLQSVLGDSAVVMWTTNQAQPSSVEYGVIRADTKTVTASEKVYIHQMMLSGLQRGRHYVYRVRSDTLQSTWFSFQAAKPAAEPFCFAMYGDNRTNFLRHREIVTAMATETPDFVINTGDIVMNGLRPDWDTEFFQPLENLICTVPVYVSLGNHENNTLYLDKKTLPAHPQAVPYSHYFKEYFAFPEPEHETYYSFTYGNAFFVFIDNNLAGYPDRKFPDIRKGSDRYRWLEAQLASPAAQEAEWLIVTAHIPVVAAEVGADFPLNRESIWPLFQQYDVDIFFSGHIHNYERSCFDGIYHVVSGGGGGPQDIRILNQTDLRKQRTNYHYCMVNIDGPVLQLQFKDRQQHILDQFTIDKQTTDKTSEQEFYPQTLGLSIGTRYEGALPVPLVLTLPDACDYRISIYNSVGKPIRQLVEGHASQGTYWLHWDRYNQDGYVVPAGDYVCRVKTARGAAEVRIRL